MNRQFHSETKLRLVIVHPLSPQLFIWLWPFKSGCQSDFKFLSDALGTFSHWGSENSSHWDHFITVPLVMLIPRLYNIPCTCPTLPVPLALTPIISLHSRWPYGYKVCFCSAWCGLLVGPLQGTAARSLMFTSAAWSAEPKQSTPNQRVWKLQRSVIHSRWLSRKFPANQWFVLCRFSIVSSP